MFQCVVCGKSVWNSDRIFENLDWCPDCIRKDGNILARESKNINPSSRLPNMPEPFKRYQSQRERYFTIRPPYYHIYHNQVPQNIKDKILKG
jgi:hypothetical protein